MGNTGIKVNKTGNWLSTCNVRALNVNVASRCLHPREFAVARKTCLIFASICKGGDYETIGSR